jgi:hypothetical protein
MVVGLQRREFAKNLNFFFLKVIFIFYIFRYFILKINFKNKKYYVNIFKKILQKANITIIFNTTY